MYFASTSYERLNFNSKNVSTTGLNTEQITEKKKQHAKDLNIDDRIALFQDQIAENLSMEFCSDIFQTLEKSIF